MKPEGQKHFNYPGKTDCHPPKGYINWWENEASTESRTKRKQDIKKEIKVKIEEN